jgi:hypothetical protein
MQVQRCQEVNWRKMEEAAQGQAQAEVSESTRRVPAGAKCCDRLLFGKRVLHANSGAGMPCYAVENACTLMRAIRMLLVGRIGALRPPRAEFLDEHTDDRAWLVWHHNIIVYVAC